MEKDHVSTLERIKTAAIGEFSVKGYKSASLRNIVNKAGVTTGAFYGYYKSKEELFDVLVSEEAEYFKNEYFSCLRRFKKLPIAEQVKAIDVNGTVNKWMVNIVDYIYNHKAAYKLLICKAEGTRYEDYVNNLVEHEVRANHEFIAAMEKEGKIIEHVEPNLEHILISGMFSAFFEIVAHDYSRKDAKDYVNKIHNFNVSGWAQIMKLEGIGKKLNKQKKENEKL